MTVCVPDESGVGDDGVGNDGREDGDGSGKKNVGKDGSIAEESTIVTVEKKSNQLVKAV